MPSAIRHPRKESGHVRSRDDGRVRATSRTSTQGQTGRRAADRQALRHGSIAGYSSGCWVDARRATPQIRGWRAGGWLAVSSSTPGTPLLSPAEIRELNHAAFASLSYPTNRQVLRNPHVWQPGFFMSMSIHPHTTFGVGDTRTCFSQRIRKDRTGPNLRSGPSVFSMSPNRANVSEKSNFSSPHAAAQPLNILSRPETFNAGSSKAHLPEFHQPQYPFSP